MDFQPSFDVYLDRSGYSTLHIVLLYVTVCLVCKLVDILNICITLAFMIEPDLLSHRDYIHRSLNVSTGGISAVNNASSYAVRNQSSKASARMCN